MTPDQQLHDIITGPEQDLDKIMEERDRAEDMADNLAYQIERVFHIEIGEHSNVNDPWQNAYEYLRDLPVTINVKDRDGKVCMSLDEQLHEVSGWEYDQGDRYSTDFLLDNLPPQLVRKNGGITKRWQLELEAWTDIDTDEPDGWVASYQSNRNDTGVFTTKGIEMIKFSDNHRDALINLALELFNRGILKPEEAK